MANSKGPSTIRNMMYNGKNPLLPPKSPFPSISPSYAEYIPTSTIGPKALPRPRDGNPHHQRTSSESFLIEEQPSWLDELLDEPETPVRKGGHRRSSSDSFAYIDTANAGSMNYAAQDDNKFKNMMPLPSWGSQDIDFHRDMRQSSFYLDPNPSVRTKKKPWDAPVNSIAPPRGLPTRDVAAIQNAGSVNSSLDVDRNPTSCAQKSDVESVPQDPKGSIEKKDTHVKNLASETDTKRAKQQFAQRSRVRKLQYISELERHVQVLQLHKMDAIEDIFESSLNLEESHLKEGYDEGYADGLISGKDEGQEVGLKTGFKTGEELGFYKGCVDVWSSAVQADPGFISARIQRTIKQMDELLQNYPMLEPENESVSDLMDALRLKFRAICASLNLKLEYEGYPKAADAGTIEF